MHEWMDGLDTPRGHDASSMDVSHGCSVSCGVDPATELASYLQYKVSSRH